MEYTTKGLSTGERKLIQKKLSFFAHGAKNQSDDTLTPLYEGKKRSIDSDDLVSDAKKRKLEDEPKTFNKDVEVTEICESELQTKLSEEVKVEVLSAKKKTPKQLEKEKKREEREQLRLEKEQKKQQEKEEKQRLKEEKELQRKRELAEKEEQKRKFKEDKEKLKKAELERKEEEKRKREEQKEEERRRREELKEEEKRKKEEQSIISKEAQAAKFVSFFTKINDKEKPELTDNNTQDIITQPQNFQTFQVKKGMRLAPINPVTLNNDQKSLFDTLIKLQNFDGNYLRDLKSGKVVPGKSENTWPLAEKDLIEDDIVVVDDQLELFEETSQSFKVPDKTKLLRPKLLQFHENVRPPYWGTWRKKCPQVTARQPFGQYKEFDYEVDSDDEWEEDEPGESLHGSDDEKEEEDEYELDNDFFVPHGYLSEDEEQDEEMNWSPEKQKAKLKLLGEQFDEERNAKTRQLRPVVVGCLWRGEPIKFTDEEVNAKIQKLLTSRAAVVWSPRNAPISISEPEVDGVSPVATTTPSSSKKSLLPEEALPDLIKLVHGCAFGRKALSKEFRNFWKEKCEVELRGIAIWRKIKEIAEWQGKKGRWMVKPDILKEHGLSELNLGNCPNSRALEENRSSTPLISKFAKVIPVKEFQQQLKTSTIQPKVTINVDKLQQFRADADLAIVKERGESETNRSVLNGKQGNVVKKYATLIHIPTTKNEDTISNKRTKLVTLTDNQESNVTTEKTDSLTVENSC